MGNLIYAGRALGQDLLPTIVFAILVAMKADVRVATGAAVVVSVGQLVLQAVITRRRFAPLQWASLGLVLLFGGASLMTNDPRYLMAKPTLVYTIIGFVMLQRGWMMRYLPPVAEGRGASVMVAFGYVWAGLMFVTAAANLVTAVWYPQAWPVFLAIFPMSSKIALFAIQYVSVRTFILRQVKAEQASAAQPQAA
jgi:intracellular septation protein A